MHWARDAEECNRIVGDIVAAHGADEVVKAKSLTTEETGLNEALEQRGIRAWETDLAQLIIQLADDTPSHILVPAIHKNREQIRALFAAHAGRRAAELSDDPRELAEAARAHLRKLFLSARVGISGVNFAVADTGTVSVVESEGNGRMCTTLPEVLISVMGIEKVIPSWQDLEVYLQLLPRSSTGRADEPVHLAVDRRVRRRRAARVSPGARRQRPHRRARRPDRAPGAQLHPLLGLPERLPGLRAHRRSRLRLDVPRPDRRDPHADAERA